MKLHPLPLSHFCKFIKINSNSNYFFNKFLSGKTNASFTSLLTTLLSHWSIVSQVMITEGEVAQFLIDRQYFLTALELHQELVEDPNRNPPLLLQRLFSRLPENKELEDLSAYFSSKKGKQKIINRNHKNNFKMNEI